MEHIDSFSIMQSPSIELSEAEILEMDDLRCAWMNTLSFDFLLTRACNFRCCHCLQDRFTGMLSKDQFIQSVEQIRKMKDQVLVLSGGEPLSHPEIDPIIKYLIDINMPFSFVTNGSILRDDTIELLSHAPVSISLSLDGPEAVHDRQRRHAGAFQKLNHSLDRCNKHQLEVVIIASISKDNVSHLDWLADFCCRRGVSSLRIQPIHAEGKAMKLYNEGRLLDQDGLTSMYRKIIDLSGEYIGRLSISCLGSFKSDIAAHGCRLGVKFGSACHNRSAPWPHSFGIDCEGNILPLVPYLPGQWSIGNISSDNIQNALMAYYRSDNHIRLLRLLRLIYHEITQSDGGDYFDLGFALIERMKGMSLHVEN